MDKFRDLLKEFSQEEILEQVHELYNCPTEKYQMMLDKLEVMTPVSSDCVIDIQYIKEDLDTILPEDDWWANVTGCFPDSDDSWAIEFTPWPEWLDMEIAPHTLETVPRLDIVCHCLWEMSWAGFEEETIQEYADTIKERAADAMAHPERLIPWDEVKKKYNLEDDD